MEHLGDNKHYHNYHESTTREVFSELFQGYYDINSNNIDPSYTDAYMRIILISVSYDYKLFDQATPDNEC